MNTTHNQITLASPDHPDARIESLRHILEFNQGRNVSYDEAKEVGESLITFYEVLAEGNGGQHG
jgi:hypothetical protein